MHYTIAQSLSESRRSILSGAFLTKANVLKETLRPIGLVDFRFGVHQLLDTVVASATIVVQVPSVAKPDEKTPAEPTVKPSHRSVNVQELLFGFKENPEVYFIVPRDSTLKQVTPDEHLFTFLTLRKEPGGSTLQHQIIPVPLVVDEANRVVVESIGTHINAFAEVKEKMFNAMRHIPKMSVEYLTFAQSAVGDKKVDAKAHVAVLPPDSPAIDGGPVEPVKKKATKKKRVTIEDGQVDKAKPAKKPKKEKKEKSLVHKPVTESATKFKKQKKASIIPQDWKCEICGVTTTVMRRRGPSGLNCACKSQRKRRCHTRLIDIGNSCGQAWSARARSASQKAEKSG